MIRRKTQDQIDRRAAKVAAKAEATTKAIARAVDEGDVEKVMELTAAEILDGPECIVLNRAEFTARFRISSATFWREIERGRLRPKFVGTRMLISLAEADRWFRSLPSTSGQKGKHPWGKRKRAA
jgi:hypothetical protein